MKYAKGYHVRKRGAPFYIAVVLAVILVILIASSAGFFMWYQSNLKPVSKDSAVQTYEVATGAATNDIALELQEKNIIRNAQAFMLYLRLHQDIAIKAGTYQLDAANSTPDIIAVISDGSKVIQKKVTILPGKRLDQIRASLIAAGFSESDVDAALDPARYVGHPALIAKPQEQTLEGYLFPETFSATSTTTATDIIEKSLDQMAQELSPDIVSAFERNGLDIHQAVTLASIVIKESSDPEAQKIIAGVFYNRLKQGMVLGSDVTYQYIADITGQPRSAFIESPYNTRKYPGLPPGPIANTNNSSLYAVAYPTNTDYLYFVAGDDGNIYYATTLTGHEENVRLHCFKLCETY